MRPAPDDSPPLPGFTAPVWRIDCEFEPGCRFVFAELREKSPLPGNPREFSCWIHGDASGVSLRLRLRDAAGRTWQPDGGTVDWHGWKPVHFKLGPDTAHWGGTGAAQVKYPLTWESPLLIDNTSRRATHSSILVTAPAGVVLSVASLPES